MLYYTYDPETKVFTGMVEAEAQPPSSTPKAPLSAAAGLVQVWDGQVWVLQSPGATPRRPPQLSLTRPLVNATARLARRLRLTPRRLA